MKKTTFLCLSVFSLFMFSCNENELESTSTPKVIKSGNLEFIYNGVKYSSEYKIISDSSISFENKSTQTIYENLQKKANLASFESQDGTIEFFDSYAALSKEKSLEEIPQKKSIVRGIFPSYYSFYFYIDADYKGKVLNLSESQDLCPAPKATGISYSALNPWQDIISSMSLTVSFSIYDQYYAQGDAKNKKNLQSKVVTLFKDNLFSGKSRSIELTRNNSTSTVSNFNDIHYQSGLLSWKSWNDCVSSISITDIYVYY